MYAKVFNYFNESGSMSWAVNVWEHPSFGAYLLNGQTEFKTVEAALDWLWNKSGNDVSSIDIRKVEQ
jgi:hypothetical protein